MNTLLSVNKNLDDYIASITYFSQNIHESATQILQTVEEYNRKLDRTVENFHPHGKDLVLTTYLTSKKDPQRDLRVSKNDFKYIERWYESINSLGLKAIVFVDTISNEFIDRYSNDNVRFVRCTVGNMSLNDERYFLFLTYLLRYVDRVKSIFLTDANDVVFLKSPFQLIEESSSYCLYVGRNNTNKILYSEINKERLKMLKQKFGLKIPGNFYTQPVYNAGIVGGSKPVILFFLIQMCKMLRKYESDKNLNMIILNMVIYKFFLPRNVMGFFNSKFTSKLSYNQVLIIEKLKMLLLGKRWEEMKSVNNINDVIGNTKIIRTSFPLHNAYKSYQSCGEEFLIHK